MSLRELGEFGFIERIRAHTVARPEHVIQSIGDDCAVVRSHDHVVELVTTDLLIERVHFLRHCISGEQLGAKAMAVNLSDIAAMGGTARDAYVSIAIPEVVELDYLDGIYVGLKRMAKEHGVNLLGGDTSGSKQDLVINVTVVGNADEESVLYRHTARAEDHIFVTGQLGDSGAGLKALASNGDVEEYATAELIRRHLEPRPHLREGRIIASSKRAHAMLDVSDGLAPDIDHICERSGLGCIIDRAALPLSAELLNFCHDDRERAAELALRGGEDYVLLCTGTPELGSAVRESGIEIYDVGVMTSEQTRLLRDESGNVRPLGRGGWDHMRRSGI